MLERKNEIRLILYLFKFGIFSIRHRNTLSYQNTLTNYFLSGLIKVKLMEFSQVKFIHDFLKGLTLKLNKRLSGFIF